MSELPRSRLSPAHSIRALDWPDSRALGSPPSTLRCPKPRASMDRENVSTPHVSKRSSRKEDTFHRPFQGCGLTRGLDRRSAPSPATPREPVQGPLTAPHAHACHTCHCKGHHVSYMPTLRKHNRLPTERHSTPGCLPSVQPTHRHARRTTCRFA